MNGNASNPGDWGYWGDMNGTVGDIEVSDSFELPVGIKPGEYELQAAIIDAGRFGANKPAIKLANESKDSEGWYTIGSVNIK